jgi:FtsP/CotA-like multicopper oxidase with cupredoxin domain
MTNLHALGLLASLIGTLGGYAPGNPVVANDNRVPAGALVHGVLTLRLRVTHGIWHPDGDTDPGADVIAFAEEGHAASIPGPLVRVPAGTLIRTTIRNALTDSSIVIYGLSGARTLADTVRIRPGETRTLETRVAMPGTYLYRGLTWVRDKAHDPRLGSDAMLGGALVVDPPGARVRDRVLVIFQWRDSVRMHPVGGMGDELLSINGKSWPHTEHLDYQLGDTIRWRVVNASFDLHPMHLHGAFFTVTSHGGLALDTTVAAAERRLVVTERMGPLSTMAVQWVPAHAGNWLFHCHLNFHLVPHAPLAGVSTTSPPAHSMMSGMAGLIMGVTVHGPIAADVRPRRMLRLVVEQYDSVPGEYVPPFSYEIDDARRRTVPGAPIVVTQNEPIAITVVNHLPEPTSVHWHGVEVQSYYDGVAGFDGYGKRLEPVIPPRDSFVVLMTPPRAGTFIYHSHFDDVRQEGGGLYGAFVVLPPGAHWDAAHERVIMLGEARDTGALKINGADHPTIAMTAGETYRLRLINITLDRPGVSMSIVRDGSLARWRPIARDGADLVASQVHDGPAMLPITIGETDDVLFTPPAPGRYALEVRSGKGDLLRSAELAVAASP